ncbi:1-(5-phosphoribosyl)-5-[(5-phosphoribosylamino)methylideneamino]imidazole-4-carboxamide isomerase [Alkalibaculum sp. M08DMB]|uniref:1-(5-phosphoribosyl)-5-[(5-phosphoribosylamino)methylideneamino] imidazole-4-carboxamide isomerase n=1 Tax=Alkalibaculum sporogenes TaxID=2655001 RepID=A0A6A7K7I2_9FIRM|nr:1-(5-phosphoribosyl)-5-[(5-phosphoribosylamino)methylideneamino]imidazole-4-carboxamide isomerase [Alkalibaculum sporogenes]MPW25355.1 1-(5-phosphoribosyl)-5-[(5-phosphoribosylamino)methylideneamino]imidazole-4-carboxamide isomerase [Alkalibaculum sporogenes]
MIVFPAIDIKGGKCVRLKQGLMDQVTSYYDDPVFVAKMWQDKGAKYLHVVDLDGAFNGSEMNFTIVKAIVDSVDIPVQIGGGIRTKETIGKYLSLGVNRVILGTKAVENIDFIKEVCELYPNKICVSVDAKGDYVAIKGWVETSNTQVIPFCKTIIECGVSTIVYTDISRDGMLSGPNLEMLSTLHTTLGIDIIASGGIANIDNIRDLISLNLYGAITGKALYEETLTMEEVNRLEEKGRI